MLKFIADECVNQDIVLVLRQSGLDVLTIREAGLTGTDDEFVFNFAHEHKRILLTYDRGFGDIFRFNISKSNGIIIILIGQMEKNKIAQILLSFISTINKTENLLGKLVIIGKSKIRITNR
ncbi:MAG: DUF5615 family PIN-like protein [bacterium]